MNDSFIHNSYNKHGVVLKKSSGGRWQSPCPFHAETKPSFIVYPDGSFHCFGCRAHGTIYDFLERFGDISEYSLHRIDLTLLSNDVWKYKNDIKNTWEHKLRKVLSKKKFSVKEKAYDVFDRSLIEMNFEKIDSKLEMSIIVKKKLRKYFKSIS